MPRAPKVISEEFVKRSIIKFLTNKGWARNLDFDDLRAQGVDIKVTNSRYGRTFFIEAKGVSTSRSGFENAFIHSLGQIITRMKSMKARSYFGIALPKRSADIAIRRIPYQLAVLVCLHVFSVRDDGKVTWYKPADLKKYQSLAGVTTQRE
jgi:hypothetical protein